MTAIKKKTGKKKTMQKNKVVKIPKGKENELPLSTMRQFLTMRRMADIAMMNVTGTQARDAIVRGRINRDIDMDYECRWPSTIKPDNYSDLYDRNGVAGRVVTLWPSECWIQPPKVYEEESADIKTEFEKAWKALEEGLHILSYLKRVDVLSGIGRYGVLFLGLDDLAEGEKFTKPVEGIDPDGNGIMENAEPKRKLLYMRAFQEANAVITEWEKGKGSPRYGKPKEYEIKMENPIGTGMVTEKVHWSRVIHVVDNRLSSEVFGEPRMKPVYNDIIDLRKLKGGMSEGYWRACLSGTAWTLDKDLVDAMVNVTTDEKDDMRDQLEDYYNSLQRDLFLEGYLPHDISPKLVDPSPFAEVLLKLICIRLEIPYNIFIGDEGRLEGRQQRSAWLERVTGRQLNYLTPELLMPTIQYLQAVGVLPQTKESPKVEWPERDSPTEADIAKTAESTTNAMSKYVSGNVNSLIGEREYLSQVFKKSPEEIDAIAEEVENWEEDNEVNEDIVTGPELFSPDDNNKKGNIE